MTSSPKPSSAASPALWSTVEPVGLEALARARREAINIAQWLARIANSFVSIENPKDRVSLEFNAARTAFVTRTFDNQLALEMRLPTLEMQFLENGKPVPHVFDPDEHSPAKVEAWLLVELLHRGVDRSKFSKALPYQVQNLMSGDAENHSPRSCSEGLTALGAWFRNADLVLQAAAGEMVNVVCWPQDLNLKCCSGAKTTGFGFSPGDIENPEPFFYVSRLGIVSRSGIGRIVLPASFVFTERNPIAAANRLLRMAE